MWTDGSQQQRIDGKEYAGYGVWFGEGHALNYTAPLKEEVQTNDRAEMTAAIHALDVTPRTLALQICVDSQLVTDGVTKWLEGWKRRSWKTKQKFGGSKQGPMADSRQDLGREAGANMLDKGAVTRRPTWQRDGGPTGGRRSNAAWSSNKR